MSVAESSKMDFMDEAVLDAVFDDENELSRQRKINELRQIAKEQKLTAEFDAAVKARKKAIREMERLARQREEQERRKKRESEQDQPNSTHFEGLDEFGFSNLPCGPWTADETGVWMFDRKEYKVIACSHPIIPVQRLKNIQTGKEKITIGYKRGGHWQFQTVRKEVIASANQIVGLAAYSVLVTSESAKALVRYLSDVEAGSGGMIGLRESSSKFGFVRGRFLPYDSDDIEFDSDSEFPQLVAAIREHGDRDVWFNHIKEIRASKSFPAQILMAASFGSVLLEKLGALPFVVDLWGDTEAGKTVAEMVTCSIWADPTESKYIGDFKATEVSLETKAAALNHLPLILDDTAKVSKRIRENFEGFIYDMTSGKGKSRSDKSLGFRSENAWRLTIITTGESPLNGFVSQGGAINRILEVHALTKIFEDPHKTAETVKHHYGFGGREFVDVIKAMSEAELKEQYESILFELRQMAGESMQKQVMSLAVVLLADRIATDNLFHDGIYIPLPVALNLLSDPDEVSSNERCYRFLVDEINMNRARFDKEKPIEQWGVFDSESVVCLFPTAINRMCASGGYSFKAFKDYAVKRGLFQVDGKGNPQKQKKIGTKNVRMYFLNLPNEDEPTPPKDEFMKVTDDGDGLPFL